MAWYLTKPLVNFRTQLDEICPNRDKTSDGSIGDFAHSQGSSDHNPDDTGHGNAGWDGDADNVQDVRAIDVDRDLNTPGLSMERLHAHLLKYCRNGTFWFVRYIIFDGYIYHKNYDNYIRRTYTGSNPHNHHMHISSEWSEAADDANANWRFDELLEEDVSFEQADKDWITNQLGILKNEMCNQVPWASGGGTHAPVGDGVLNSSWPLTPGAQRTSNWSNLQKIYTTLVEVKESLALVNTKLDNMGTLPGADIAYIKSAVDQIIADPAVEGFSHPIVAAVEFAENNEP